jgi:3-hydroxybutyryl-CoA dehydrogenase
MKILVIGSGRRISEFQEKWNENDTGNPAYYEDLQTVPQPLNKYPIIFHLNLDDKPADLMPLVSLNGVFVIGCAVKQSLASMVHQFSLTPACILVGMNALPTFINRPLVEWSLFDRKETEKAIELAKTLKWDMQLVNDRVGMVTPRILSMIINEACFTVQEGTATKEDIDLGMKLGMNYPFGPFEWADKIGISNVYGILDALFTDTADERFRICPMLKTVYLKKGNFLN